MAILGVDDFKSKLTGGGARPNLFKVTCNFPTYVGADVEKASFMVRAAQLPASILGMVEVPFRGRKLMMAGDRSFEAWTITVLNDTDFAVRDAFEIWSNGINAHSANTGLANPTDYFADMVVEQLDNSGSTVKKYDFRGTWPSNVGAIELNYDEATAIEEFEVELQIQYWESNTTS
tara:strand:- start:1012 stop:1539 length:528 start_codon:yes stop_codon:yes gene_type:complete